MARNIEAVFLALALLGCTAWPASDGTNDFYDDAPTVSLGTPKIYVAGEIGDPGPARLSKLPLRSVLAKETRLDGDSAVFVGAYRYDGYSLYDILNERVIRKKNEKEFPRAIDLFIEIANAAGDKVVLSWGEIYYPYNRHQIIIATKAAPIVPSKTKDRWPLPPGPKLVVGTDLVAVRNIDSPTSITVRSYPRSFAAAGQAPKLHSPVIHVYHAEKVVDSIVAGQRLEDAMEYPAVFYGRGKGIHGISRFRGAALKAVLGGRWPANRGNLRRGLVAVAALDGYRCLFSYSEMVNRNDQNEMLLVPRPEEWGGGAYSLFAPGDFFSDRAVKAVSQIRFELADSLELDN